MFQSLRAGSAVVCAALAIVVGRTEAGDARFADCGTILNSFECGFTLVTDSGAFVLLSDIEPFELGDTVFATGTLVDCDQGFPKFCEGIPCLENGTLAPCLDECGTLVQGVECVLFQGTSGLYILENLGGFTVGDDVRVTGGLDPDCVSFCLQGDGCITGNLISSCALFSGCGELQIGPQGCVLFVPDDGNTSYVLQEYGKFSIGDHVFVEGPINEDIIGCFPVAIPVIENTAISSCATPFEACGMLVVPPFCGIALAADTGGLWLLNDVGTFEVGDRVHISGTLLQPCFVVPECQVDACVDVDLIDPCGETYFSGCGQIVVSFTCGLSFAADDGSGIYVLDDFGDAEVGDVVFVQGSIEPGCPEGNGFCACIANVGVSACVPIGDLNGDGKVDGADVGILLSAWGPCPIFQIGCTGDLNFDGLVNGADLGILLSNWMP